MPMKVTLTPEQEKIVLDKFKSGPFRSVEDVLGEPLLILREK